MPMALPRSALSHIMRGFAAQSHEVLETKPQISPRADYYGTSTNCHTPLIYDVLGTAGRWLLGLRIRRGLDVLQIPTYTKQQLAQFCAAAVLGVDRRNSRHREFEGQEGG